MPKSKVFLAWSGERSQAVALALRKWLKNVIQDLDPWMSEIDIKKGKRWRVELSAQLQDIKAGIVCLTPENLKEPWINFEAGALSKLEDSYVFTYLHDLDPTDVSGPLVDFQHTKANKPDTWQLIRTLNASLKEAALEESTLEEAFNVWWEKLEKALSDIKAPVINEPVRREVPDMFREVVSTLRSHSNYHARMLNVLEALVEWHVRSAGRLIIDKPKDTGPKRWRSLGDMVTPGELLADMGTINLDDPSVSGLLGLGMINQPDPKRPKRNIRSQEDDPE
ncbi:MAG: toll/interleukin-1 receptor domain-containing protein [Nitrospira sp. BO4]|jgi:hypothetical protein|nr:toll/interleukin-1 receptor domain-containing protein [Nitrospira sp. BO4]